MHQTTYGPTYTPDLSSGLSANLWNQGEGGCPRDQIRNSDIRGVYFDTDYVDVPLPGAQTAQIQQGQLKVYSSGGVVGSESNINGVEMAGGLLATNVLATDGVGSFAQAFPCFLLSGSEANSGKLWFEHKMCFTPITTDGVGFILGLAETELFTLAAAVPLNGGDAMTAGGGFIGFNKLEDGLGVLNSVRSDRAAGAPTIIQANIGSVAAYAFVKLGMFYDPANAVECLTFYVNGVKQANVISRAQLQAFTYIDANALGLLFSIVADSAGLLGKAWHDWTKIYQLLP